MTLSEAQVILAIVERHRLSNTTPGRTASQAVAEHFGIPIGAGLHKITNAQHVAAVGEACCEECGRPFEGES
jgi:hypothetical protein